MSSSISDSDRADPRWRGFVASFAAVAGLVLAGALGLLAALDPYDTGRFSLWRASGVPEQGPRTADASRGRDPRFDAAIFGNSHAQMLRPETLKAETGFDFVSLTVPGTYPGEQLTLMDWFLRQHALPRAMVIGLDETWCLDALRSPEPFPFWLYDANPLVYLGGLLRYSALEHVPGRIALLLGMAKPARPDGYWDYSADYANNDHGLGREPFVAARPVGSPNPRGVFPAAARLQTLLGRAPASAAVVLVWPPVYISALPLPGSAAEATSRMCHAVFAGLAAMRPRTAVVDWAVDRPETRLTDNFFNQKHYRAGLAQALQKDVAAALAAMPDER
jgi:hypothetical protein